MPNQPTQITARAASVLQLSTLGFGFVIVALILGHLNPGGLAANGDQLTWLTLVVVLALWVVLRLQALIYRDALDDTIDVLKTGFGLAEAHLSLHDTVLEGQSVALGAQGRMLTDLLYRAKRQDALQPFVGRHTQPAEPAPAPAPAEPATPPRARAAKKAPAKAAAPRKTAAKN